MPTEFSPHPAVTAALGYSAATLAQYDEYLADVQAVAVTRYDDTKTVCVTLDHVGAVDGAWMRPGTSGLGAAVVNTRLNEALGNARAAFGCAVADMGNDHARKFDDLERRGAQLTAMIAAAQAPHAVSDPDRPESPDDDDDW